MARINVSIPDELKDQMDSLPRVNWSRVAQEAFSTTVRLESLKGQDVSTETIGLERLRASRASFSDEEEARGVSEGKQWALRDAPYDTLVRVCALADVDFANDDDAAMQLQTAIYAEDARAQWDKRYGSTEAYVIGFVNGASEVLEQV